MFVKIIYVGTTTNEIYVGTTTNEIYVGDPIRGSVKTQEES